MNILDIPGFSEPFSSISHLIAAVLSLVGLVVLCRRGRGNSARLSALIIYSLSLIFLFSMSGVYHLLEPGGGPRDVLQRLDHAAIWMLIAGTFTPLHIILFRGAWRWAVLTLVWTIAITGLVLEVVFFKSFPEWLSLSLFLALGWVGAFSGYKFRSSFAHHSLRYLIGGGVFYSLGAVIDFARWPILINGVIGPHEIFHIFVVLGAWAHWQFMYLWAEHPVSNTIMFYVRVLDEKRFLARARGEWIQVEADSRQELHSLILKRVSEKYHPSIAPQIRLRYFQEEYLAIGK
jgi:hemolysin III